MFEGATNQQIADARGVSVRTVSKQIEAIYRKLHVTSRAELDMSSLAPQAVSIKRACFFNVGSAIASLGGRETDARLNITTIRDL